MVRKLAFLLSGWYSGTTLLTMLLDRHPDVVSNGEAFPFSGEFQAYVCTCGSELRDCSFYRMAAGHMYSAGAYDQNLFLRSPAYHLAPPLAMLAATPRLPGRLRHRLLNLHPRYQATTIAFVEAHQRFMSHALEYTGAQVYLDGTKSLRRADIFLQHMTCEPRIWLLIKDCRGYCATVLRVRRWPQHKAVAAAREWLEYIKLARRLAGNYQNVPFRIIRYEDLCANPDAFLRDLVSELGVTPDFEWRQQRRTPHILGNKMRMDFDGTVKTTDERWKTELGPRAQAAVLRVAGRAMVEFGYI